VSRKSGPPEWPDSILHDLEELSRTIREPDRRERMRALIETAAAHYRDAGEHEPESLKKAREWFAAGEEPGKTSSTS
jgi:hypothetical protein